MGGCYLTTPARLWCVILCSLSPFMGAAGSSAQDTGSEVRPELNLYLQLEPMIRVQFQSLFVGNLTANDWRANFTFFIETALKPILRRQLRQEPDVYRNRYLTFSAGYRYGTNLANGGSTHE